MKAQNLRPRLHNVDVIALVVVVQADAVAARQAGEAAQRRLQHRLGVADVQEVLLRGPAQPSVSKNQALRTAQQVLCYSGAYDKQVFPSMDSFRRAQDKMQALCQNCWC